MTNRQRVYAVLNGERPDRVPFTTYEWKIPWGYDKRKLCERGLVMMQRFPGWRVAYPHCELKTVSYTENGKGYEREIVTTPKGQITSLFLPGQTCNVRRQEEYWIKGESDYEPLMFMVNDAVFTPAYDDIKAADEALGDDGCVWVWAGYSPLQKIILQLAGIEQYCYELMDRPDYVWALYDALREQDRKKYPILADAPVKVIQYCANPVATLLGRKLFVEKILPCLNECAEHLHAKGKLQSVHVDGDNAVWAEDLAASSVDIIEAFTPAPDTDMTMAEARRAFKDKIIWANFPSSVHLASAEKIRSTTKDLLEAIGTADRFLLGITEDIPSNRWRISLNAILDVIDKCGVLPPA